MQAVARSDTPAATPCAGPADRAASRGGWRGGRRAPRLRVVLALGFGTLGFLTTLALAALVSREATRRLEAEVGGQLAEIAGQMARGLDIGMFERWRDIQIAAASDSLRDPGAGTAAKRAVMERLQATYPAYSIIGLIDAGGRFSVTSTGALEGADVSGRDYFRAGRAGPYVGDVHPAKLLEALMPPDEAAARARRRASPCGSSTSRPRSGRRTAASSGYWPPISTGPGRATWPASSRAPSGATARVPRS
ncbi:hypothetical protein R1A27_01265 [Methylobacterium sp. NMS12]|uniref:hypothetical protein n=1 Tax=Methylobacterium sp. NMS12 TaxID=3079766 RepID=UPI003F8851E9